MPPGPVDLPTARIRQAIEALRAGVVPAFHVRDYTIGRQREIADFEALLGVGRGLRLLWGDYGTGKTHLLDVFDRTAREANFLTARAVLNPRDVPPSNPQRLYRSLLQSLSYPDGSFTGWRPLFEKLSESAQHRCPGGESFSRFFSPVLHALHTGDDAAISWASDHVEGYRMEAAQVTRVLRGVGWRGPTLLTLPDYRTFGRMYTHMIGALACWARDAGYRGLVLLMDEVERVDVLGAKNRRLAEQVLKHYAAATVPAESLCFDIDSLYRGGHVVHQAIPITYENDQPLVAVLAFTPLPESREMTDRIVKDDSVHLSLAPLDSREVHRLVDSMADLYRRGYAGFDPGPETLTRFWQAIDASLLDGLESPRLVVRAVVDLFDALRYGRDPFGDADAAGLSA